MILRNELHWLTRHYKAVRVPLVVHDSACPYGGYYQFPTRSPVRIGERELDARSGLIALASTPTPGTLAHEYRHHLQFDTMGHGWVAGEHATCPLERDAFAFEASMHGKLDEVTDWYRSLLGFHVTGRVEATNRPIPRFWSPLKALYPPGEIVYPDGFVDLSAWRS